VATKPVRRWEIVIGKWLGFAGMLGLYLLLMAGGVLTITKLLGGYTPPHILRGLGLMWFEGLLLLSLTFLWGTSFSTLTTGVITLGLQGLAFIGGWIEQIGATINRPTAIKVGIVASLVMPSEALWRRAAFEMQSAVINALGVSPFGTASVPSSAMVIYAGMYLAVALSLAVHRFSRRDL
jgi:ABC-type transport system involved in multi-copper enzyme maturation permease subunit